MANLDPLALQCFLILSRLICSLATCGTLWILWVFEPRLLIWGIPIFILVTTNDILMLTLDLQRTNSYVGSTLFQGMVSLMSITSFIIYFERSNSYSVLAYMGSGEEAIYLACAIPAIVPALISFFLLICNVQTLLSTQLPVPIWSAWSTNSKDITLGFNPASSPPRLTWRGDSRTVPLPNRRRLFWLGMVVIGRKVWGVVTNLFLRRVSPSETTIYAFIRNTFAVISMAFIMWRAGVAISKAQNAFEMRRVSEICNQPQPDISSIQILFAIPKAYPDCLNNAPDFTINVSSLALGASERACSSRSLNSSILREGGGWFGDRFTIFDCNRSDVFDAYAELNFQLNWDPQLCHTPHIWISNKLDTFNQSFSAGIDESGYLKSTVPWFTQSWRLRPGFHLSAEAGFVTRRFITSSLFREVILQKQPVYQEMAMYPISTTRVEDSSSSTTASGTISLLFQQNPIFKSRENYQLEIATNLCDYVEDYRSSTIFDVLGSIGGLFALFQSLHLLFFGRPMLWGLTGAKLISPFGLLGICGTRGFKERLREQYHQPEPTSGTYAQDTTETIRLGAFLRDFVIDFGPADVDNVPGQTSPETQPSRVYELPLPEHSEISLLSIPHVDREGIQSSPISSGDALVSKGTNKDT